MNSSSESDSSEKIKNLPIEVRNMVSILNRIRKELLKHVKEASSNAEGEEFEYLDSNDDFKEMLKGYVSQCGDTSQQLMDRKQMF